MSTIQLICYATGTTLVAAVLTWVTIGWGYRHNILDRPNDRSSHQHPTPRGGGVAIVTGFYGGALMLAASGHLELRNLATVLCGLPVAIIGYLDDLRPLKAKTRLLVQVISAIAALSVLPELPRLTLGSCTVPTSIAVTLYGIALVWMTNLYNFMDGIDAMAAGQAIVIGLLWAAFLPVTAGVLPLLLAAASVGFLIFNWPPARIFMGDVGSGFCGFIFGLLTLVASNETGFSPIVWAIPLCTFACDATVTLIVRTVHGHRPDTAHRSHAYQRLAYKIGAHLPVSIAYMGITAIVGGVCLGWAVRQPDHAMLALLFFAAPLTLAALVLRAGCDG